MTTLLALLLAAAPPAPPDSGAVAVRIVRFFRAGTGQTQVAAFIQTPPVPAGALTLRVVESTGETLWEQSWQRPLHGLSEEMVDHLRFAVVPGEYAVEVAVRDSAGNLVGSTRAPFQAFDANPGLSDLLIAPLIRAVHPSDTMPRPEEYRRGNLLITAPGVVRVGVESLVLHYFLEAYTSYGGQALLGALVRDSVGGVVREAPPAGVRIPPELGVLTGQLDLSGMTPGRYSLVTVLTIGERKLERSAGFEIASAKEP